MVCDDVVTSNLFPCKTIQQYGALGTQHTYLGPINDQLLYCKCSRDSLAQLSVQAVVGNGMRAAAFGAFGAHAPLAFWGILAQPNFIHANFVEDQQTLRPSGKYIYIYRII